jgi:predicted AlkP superfamily pyrophosphatase or phosphodiesterase
MSGSRPHTRVLILLVAVGGLAGAVVGFAGSVILGVVTGLVVLGAGVFLAWWISRPANGAPKDPGRRRFLVVAGAGGLLWALAGPAVGWGARKLARPAARPVQQAMAKGLGSEYMELVRRSYHPGRSGDLQLLLAPFNSANYADESLSLVPQDPRTSHASVWMYLERVPLLVYAPGRVVASDSAERVTLADLSPTAAQLMGFDAWPADERAGRPLPLSTVRSARPPKVVVTFVFDGGGWNVLDRFPDQWPNLKRLMAGGANFRNAIHGSFPAVTACAHATIGTGTFPNEHGITGHNIRDGAQPRKAYRQPGLADPGDILVPTLSDLWYQETDGKAWVGEIGYQVWHVGMLGYGGKDRADGSKPVGVFWDERGDGSWQPHNPDLYRLPAVVPGTDVYAQHQADFVTPDWDDEFAPEGTKSACCSPPIVRYQGDLIAATFDAEPIGQGEATDLLYINYKSPDYTGHVYGMASKWTGLQLETVDEQLGRLVDQLDERLPGEYVLMVTADHGQCPLPDSEGGVRLDPIQLDAHIEEHFSGVTGVVQEVVPHEVYLDTGRLWDNGGATVEDVAASLQDYRYRQNLGPYVPRSAVEQSYLDQKEFAGVFATTYLGTLTEDGVATLGETAYPEGDTPIPGPPESY